MLKILLYVFFLSSSAIATELTLLNITNDENKTSSSMYIKVDESNDIQEFGQVDYESGIFVRKKIFFNFLGYDGVVLRRENGRDIVILRGLNVDSRNGGQLDIDFLYNGMTGRRNTFSIELDQRDGLWSLRVDNKIIKHIHLKSHRRRWIGLVGIKYIEIIE